MNNAELQPNTQEIVADEVFPPAPEVLWKALPSAEQIGGWLMAATRFEAVQGTHFTFQTTPGGAWNGVIHCQVLEAILNERLVYAWQGGHPETPAMARR